MSHEDSVTDSAARQVVRDLLSCPPVSQAELRSRLAGTADEAELRRTLVATLADGDYTVDGGSVLSAALGTLGVDPCKNALRRIVADPEQSEHVTVAVMDAVAQARCSPGDLLEGLPAEQAMRLMARHFRHTVGCVVSDEVNGPILIVDMLEKVIPERRADAFDALDATRKQSGVPAASLYEHLVGCESLTADEEVRERVLDAIVEEGGEQVSGLLARLRDSTADAAWRRRVQRALLRVGTAAIDPTRQPEEPQKGKVYLGTCDGQGAYVLAALYKRRFASSSSIADVCIRAAEDIRDGFTVPRQREADLRAMLERLDGGTGTIAFVPVPWGEAAALVRDAVERTQAIGKTIPDDARAAVQVYQRAAVPASARQDALAAERPGGAHAPEIDAVRRLLDLPIYDSWFFDTGDLEAIGAHAPSRTPRNPEDWIKATAKRLDTPTMRAKLVAMAEHMALWHHYKGSGTSSATMAALARTTARSAAKSPLVHVMLERTLEVFGGAAPRGEPFGPFIAPTLQDPFWTPGSTDPATRHMIKRQFFADVQKPTRADLARVDFCEVVYLALDSHVGSLPGDRRPRPTELADIAMAAASAFLADPQTLTCAGTESEMDNGLERLQDAVTTAIVRASSLSVRDAEQIALPIAYDLAGFALEWCTECRLACLTEPDADASRAFFGSGHPYAPADDTPRPRGGASGPADGLGLGGKDSRAKQGESSAAAKKKKKRQQAKRSRRRSRR